MNGYLKEFTDWNAFKEKIDSKEFEGYFHAREVWWVALGINVGSEQDGKNATFERPVLIVRKIKRDLLLIAPMTTSLRSNKYRVNSTIGNLETQILIQQIRTISSKRLLRKSHYLDIGTFRKILILTAEYVLSALENETPPQN